MAGVKKLGVSGEMGLGPNHDIAARWSEAYKQYEIPLIANMHGVSPVEVSRKLRKSGFLTEIQSFEISFIVEKINSMPKRAIEEYLGVTTTQLDQALARYNIRDLKEVCITRDTCISNTHWLVEEYLELPINDQLPRIITNEHFIEHGLYPAVAFATASKKECPTARHFSACAFLICEAYPDRFKPWQFRHAKRNTYFSGEEGQKNFLNALLWLTKTKMGITRQTLPYAVKNHNFLNARTLQEYGLGVHWWGKHWSDKDKMLAAFIEFAGVTPVGHCGQNAARVRAQSNAAGPHHVVQKATRRASNFRQAQRRLPPDPALPPTECSDPVELQENEVRTIMARGEFDLSRGSQTLAKDFRKQYPKYNISLKRLEQLFNKIRGKTLPRGRPCISRSTAVNV